MKRSLKELNKLHFAHISGKVERAREDLKRAQIALHDRLEDVFWKKEVIRLQTEASFLVDTEEKVCGTKN